MARATPLLAFGRRFGLAALAAGSLALAVQPAGAQPRTLTISLPANVNTLDPVKSTTVGTDLSVVSHIYTPLVERGPDMQLRPALAQSWQAVNDTTWRFELRPDVTAANGERLDAEAVKWNLERILDPATAARNRPWFAAIREVRVLGPTTVEFVTAAPYPDLPAQMTMLFVMPPRWTAQANPSVSALGSGPYELAEFRSGDRVVLRARPDHFAGRPAFDRVVFRVIPDEAARIAAVLAGDVDLITAFPASEMTRLRQTGRVNVGAVEGTRAMFVKLNALRPPFRDNPKLWRALNLAVDRQAIVDSLWEGQGRVAACQPLSPIYFGYNPDLRPPPHDPAQARRLLREAGYPNGLQIELEVPTGRYTQATDVAQIIAAQLGEVGVQVRLTELEFGTFMNKYLVARNLADAAYFGLAWPTLDAGGLLNFWESTNPQAYWENPEFTRMAVEARSTTDAARRTALYRELTQRLCDAAPMIHLFFPPVTYAESRAIGWQARGDDWIRAMDVRPR